MRHRRADAPRGRLVIGLEVHGELATATKLFCGCPNHFGDEPNTNVVPGVPRPARLAAGAQRAGGRAGHPARPGRCDCEVQPSVFARKNYFYPDMPKDYQISQYDLPINVDGYARAARRARRRHRAGPPRGGHRQVHPRRRRRPHPRRRLLASSTTTAPACRCSRSCRGPTCARPSEARAVRHRAARDPRRHRRLRRQDGGGLAAGRRQRVGAPPGRRRSAPAARSRTSTRCARSAGPSSTRPGARSTCSRPASTVAQETRHWDEDDGPHRHAALQGGGRGLPLLPRARPRPARPRRRVGGAGSTPPCRPAGRAPRPRWPRPPAPAPTSRRGRGHRRRARASTSLALAAIEAGRRRRPGARPTSSRTWPSRAPSALDPGRARRAGHAGDRRRAHRHPGQGGAGRDGGDRRRPPGDDRRGQGLRGHGRRRPRGRRRRGHRRQPRRVGALRARATTRPGASSPASSSARS